MLYLIELLESFNRKERFHLVSQAIGSFQLSEDFKEQLGEAINLAIPADAFAAMDYHLEWLAAALHAYKANDLEKVFPNPNQNIIKGNQQDTDLLVAFRKDAKYHIVLVEAKGVGSWSNHQMTGKAERLGEIFGHDGEEYIDVVPHMCLLSPRRPKRLNVSSWPKWMTKDGDSIYWFELHLPKDSLKVSRCEPDGSIAATGQYFRIVKGR